MAKKDSKENKKENKNKSKTTSKPRNPTVVRKKIYWINCYTRKIIFQEKQKCCMGSIIPKGKMGERN